MADFAGGFELGFTLIPDNEFHEYKIPIGTSGKWQGTITRLRFDPGEGSAEAVAQHATIEIDYIRVVHLGPKIELSSFALDREVMTVGDTANLALVVKNTGDETAVGAGAALELSAGLELVDASTDIDVPDVAPNFSSNIAWKITAADTGAFSAAVSLDLDGERLFQQEIVVHVTSPLPTFPPDIPAAAQVWSPFDEHWLLENGHIRLAFIKTNQGYGPIVIYDAIDGEWKQSGLIQPPGELAFLASNDQVIEKNIAPHIVAASTSGDTARLVLTHEYRDSDGATWQFQYSFAVGDAAEVNICYRVQTDQPRSLLHFAGPLIRAGEGGFAGQKEEALFPGLEWLIDDEMSSSDLDVHPPKNARYMPHPYKVTIPVMSVTSGERVIGLEWDPSQRWYQNYEAPSPLFASPNSWDGQNNHLMGLLAPSVPQWRAENASLAATPLLLQPASPLTLCARLFIRRNTGQLSAMKYWIQKHGMPPLPNKPRSYKDDIILNNESFMDVLWDDSKKGWHQALPDPWGPQSPHDIAAQVWLGALFENEATAVSRRDKMEELGQKLLIQDRNPGALGWDFGFRYGELDQAWGAIKQWAQHLADNQNDDGGRLYSGDPALQNQGDTSLGTNAWNTYLMLQCARISGDSYSLNHGLAGLEFMKQFRVPRGAQTWEVPLHAPDILAAAHAVLAYTEGYKLTGEQRYLDEAVRWAYAGLPFVYLWSAADRPIMAYGSIPVFGATWYSGAWFGKLVQWNGLDYAYALLKLWQVDKSQSWKHIAEGLTICGMQLQRTPDAVYPQNKGMYPDAYSEMLGDEAGYWDLAPEKIMQNLLSLEGVDPDVNTAILESTNGKVHVNSGINFSVHLNGEQLSIRPRPLAPDSVFFAVANAAMPKTVTYGGRTLPKVDDVDAVSSGWDYSVDGVVIIKLVAADSSEEMVVEPITALSMGFEPSWEFDNMQYAEGWTPNFDIDDVGVEDGKLYGYSIGGDPWITGPFMDLHAADYDSLVIRMSCDNGSAAQLFWITQEAPAWNEPKSTAFSLVADGNDHVYAISLHDNPNWKGAIRQLRLDPTNAAQAEFYIDYIRLIRGSGTSAPQPRSIVRTFQLLPNYPNPFYKSTHFHYILQRQARVKLVVYDVLGRQIVELTNPKGAVNEGSFVWDRRDQNGRIAPAGVYFYRLVVGNGGQLQRSTVRKLALLPIAK